MSLTDKQRAVLTKAGYKPDDYSYEKASQLIGEILSKPKQNSVPKTDFKKDYAKDVNPFYVSYAKDLIIALLQHQQALLNGGFIKKPEDLTPAVELCDQAILMVGAARQRLKQE